MQKEIVTFVTDCSGVAGIQAVTGKAAVFLRTDSAVFARIWVTPVNRQIVKILMAMCMKP